MLNSHKRLVVNVALVEQNLAADHFVARGGVAGEIDAAHEELLAFVGRQREVDLVACPGSDRRRAPAQSRCSRIRRTASSSARCPCAAWRSRRHRHRSSRKTFFCRKSVVRNSFTPTKVILFRCISWPSSTGMVISARLPGLFGLNSGYAETLAAGVAQRDRVVEHARREVAFVLIELPDAFLVFFELGGVVGLGEHVFEEDRVRNADRMQVLHRADHDHGR